MIQLRLILLGSILLATQGCITMSNAEPKAVKALDKSSAVFILGISPDYRIQISRGTKDKKGWAMDQMTLVAVNTFPTHGYIVAKVKPRDGDDSYGVTGVLPEGIGMGPLFVACTGNEVPTFHAVAGKVVYVGNLKFEGVGGKVGMRYSNNMDGAKAALAATYPGLVEHMEQSEVQFLTATNIGCTAGT